MNQINAAAVDFIRSDAALAAENRQQFGSPKVFVSEHTMLPLGEPDDTAKTETVCSDAIASGIVFVPGPNEMPPQCQLHASHTHGTVSPDVLLVLVEAKLDALQQRVEDNEDLKEQAENLTEGVANHKRQITELKSQNVFLQGRISMVEHAYEDIHGWLSDKDPEYMDRIRLRRILDCGQAQLARLANILVLGGFPSQSAEEWSRAWRAHLAQCADNAERLATARSLLANCDDDDTRDLPDNVLRYFTVKPNDARTEGDRTDVGESAYNAMIERQSEDQRPLLRLVVAYGLQFRL
ncbi:hypothetical protein IW262DRAFT_1466657 [Armillaria fumosa]|nr:hypothetical protein IW262DRAFT_1466657 [Armillaria fumosa]